MPSVVKRCAAATALLVQGGLLGQASADVAPTIAVSNLQALRKEAPLTVVQEAPQAHNTAQMSTDAADIIGGMTEAFLGGKISTRERSCLSSGASTLAAAVTQSCKDAVDAYHNAVVAGQPATLSTPLLGNTTTAQLPQLNSASRSFPYLGGPTMTPAAPAAGLTGGEETVVSLEFVARFAGLLELEKQLAKDCLQMDAVKNIESAAKHMFNATYVGNRLITNGVDILSELADATGAYDAGKFREFGQDLGGAWRKVVLSKKSFLDFEMPSAQELDEMTQALMVALFGSGMTLRVETDAQVAPMMPTAPPPQVYAAAPQLRGGALYGSAPGAPAAPFVQPGTAYPVLPSSVDIDLRTCLAGNMPLFRSAWAPVFKLFLDASTEDAADALPDSSQLLISMLDLQLALRTCGLGPQQEAVLFDAMHMGELHTKLELPEMASMNTQQERDALSRGFSAALHDWREHSWSAFGAQLGSILRDMVLLTFPQKYSLDDAGRLRSLLTELTSSNHASSTLSKAQPALAFVLFVAFAMIVLSGAVLSLRRANYAQVAISREALDDEELLPVQSFDRVTLLQEELQLESVAE